MLALLLQDVQCDVLLTSVQELVMHQDPKLVGHKLILLVALVYIILHWRRSTPPSPRPATLTLFHLLSYLIDNVLQISVTKLLCLIVLQKINNVSK